MDSDSVHFAFKRCKDKFSEYWVQVSEIWKSKLWLKSLWYSCDDTKCPDFGEIYVCTRSMALFFVSVSILAIFGIVKVQVCFSFSRLVSRAIPNRPWSHQIHCGFNSGGITELTWHYRPKLPHSFKLGIAILSVWKHTRAVVQCSYQSDGETPYSVKKLYRSGCKFCEKPLRFTRLHTGFSHETTRKLTMFKKMTLKGQFNSLTLNSNFIKCFFLQPLCPGFISKYLALKHRLPVNSVSERGHLAKASQTGMLTTEYLYCNHLWYCHE